MNNTTSQSSTQVLMLPAPRVVRPVASINYRRSAELRKKNQAYTKGDGYWPKKEAEYLARNPGYYRMVVGYLGHERDREPGTIYYRPATSGRYGKSAAVRMGAPLGYQITLSTHMATYFDLEGREVTHAAPKGMIFRADENGVYLWRAQDGMDYHPSAEDWMAKDFATRVKKSMAANKRQRAQAARWERLQAATAKRWERNAARNAKRWARNAARAERERQEERARFAKLVEAGVTVTLQDSRFAGNCVEGSLAFLERTLKIPRAEVLAGGYLFGVPAKRLLAVANGHQVAVERAIRMAYDRETTISI